MRALVLMLQLTSLLTLFETVYAWSHPPASQRMYALPPVFAPSTFALLCLQLKEDSLPMAQGRGFPCIEAVIVVGFQVRLQLLPLRGVLGLSLLFLTLTNANCVWR